MNGALQPIPEWLYLILAPPVFLVFWSFVMTMISRVGGWHNLAKKYRREETTFQIRGAEPSEQYGWSSLKMGPAYFPTNYGKCVTVSVGDDGLGLKVLPVLRFQHPPLLIPWSAIEHCQLDQELHFFSRATVQLHDLQNPLRIYGRAGRAIDRAWAVRAERNDDAGIV